MCAHLLGRCMADPYIHTLNHPTQHNKKQSGYRYLKLIKYAHWAIGQTWLRKMYLVVDRANRRVGFAPPIPGCTPPPPTARGTASSGGP